MTKSHKIGKIMARGEFISGTPWTKYDKVGKNRKVYDSKTEYCWTDPDFPHDQDVVEAQRRARKAGEPEDKWPEYLDYSKADWRFKCEGFMKYGKEVDCLPDASLGRIPVEDLEACSRRE